MKVLHVHSGNLYGGIETTLISQARNSKLCPNMELTFALCFEGRFSEELNEAGALVHQIGRLRLRNGLALKQIRISLDRIFRTQPVDVVVTHAPWSQVALGAIARKNRVPHIFWSHGISKTNHWLDWWASKHPPDFVICNSNFTASSTLATYPGLKAKVIYNPLIVSPVSYSKNERQSLRQQLSTPMETTVIVQVGRIEPLKGYDIHLNALATVQEDPNWSCWIVGGAQRAKELKYLDALKRLTKTLGIDHRVRFLGHRADIMKILAAADIYCQPNTGPETFGNTFIEALSAGKPVVTTPIGGAKEIIDETCGLLVQPGSVEGLSKSLKRLMDDPKLRSKLGEAGASRAYKLCSVRDRMKEIDEFMKQIVFN